ncbi:DUF3237 family protein [Micromonospora sp. NPDC051925]|uniref:DUF3237 family protein n=1 Tax=Micromonospora sp. NPDC051925 TaxID=3364288 RepID=UPI0037CBF2EB
MRLVHRRPLLAGVLAVATLVGAVGVTTSAYAATGCRVTYAISSQWGGGFGANVAVTNLGDPLNGWQLTWSFTAGQQVTQYWNGTLSQNGGRVTAGNTTWNASLATGASASFGFNGSWNNVSNPTPTDFALNGTPCTGSTGPSATPTVPNSPTPGTPSPTPSTPPSTPGTPSPTPDTPSPTPSTPLPTPSTTPSGAEPTIVPDPSWTCGRSGGIVAPARGRLVFRATAQLGAIRDVGTTQYGRRRILDIRGGTVTGDRINGTLLAGGLDLELTLSNGATELEQINILRTGDGTLIYLRGCGVAPAGDSTVRIVPDFEAPNSSPYAWLNTGTYAGTRTVNTTTDTLELAVYDVSGVSPAEPSSSPTRPVSPTSRGTARRAAARGAPRCSPRPSRSAPASPSAPASAAPATSSPSPAVRPAAG